MVVSDYLLLRARSPCLWISYAAQLITAPPAQPLPRVWGMAQPQPVSHALSPAIAKPWQGAAAFSSGRRRAAKPGSGSWLHSLNVSRKGDLRPPWGSSPQLLNCCLLAPVQGVGCRTWGSRTSHEIHPHRAVTQAVESSAEPSPSPKGKLPSFPSGAARAFLASQSECLSESLHFQKLLQLKITLRM